MKVSSLESMRKCAAVFSTAAHRANSKNSDKTIWSFLSFFDKIAALEEVSIDVVHLKSAPTNHMSDTPSVNTHIFDAPLHSNEQGGDTDIKIISSAILPHFLYVQKLTSKPKREQHRSSNDRESRGFPRRD